MMRADPARWLRRLCVALPLLMLAAHLLAWLRWGMDLPFFDDWRVYDEGTALSLAPARLFESVNNTLSPVGLALDVLAQRWLGGNPLPYQALSMLGVLGGLLWMQWRLLGWAVADARLRAVAFAFCLFMLQPGSYWGEQNLAYHQALPLLALLGAACLNLPQAGRWRAAAAFALGLLAGLSYISGAVAALVLGLGWVAVAALLRARGSAAALAARLRAGGWALAAAGALTSALQIIITRQITPGGRVQPMGLTWPGDADFWLFLAGSFGRASGRGFERVGAEALWVAALALLTLAAAALALWVLCARAPGRAARARRWAVVLWPLGCVIVVYLAMVSMGRAGFRDDSVSGAEGVFRLGAQRFHFFWVTLLWPWLAAGLMLAWRKTWRIRAAPLVLLALACALAWGRGVFGIAEYYRWTSVYREGLLLCLDRQLGTGQPIVCPGFAWMHIPDLSRAYVHAREVHASFTRYLPIAERGRFGADLLGGRAAPALAEPWRGAQALPDGWLQSEGDAHFVLPLPERARAARCRVLGVRLVVQADQPAAARVFYRPAGQAGYTEGAFARRPYAPDEQGRATVEFVIDTPAGFEPELRIHPHEGQGRFKLADLQAGCRLSEPP